MWNKLNVGWAGFFILCMLVNIYISQNMSEDAWVDFKSFGLLGMTFVATIVSGAYIYRYLPKMIKKMTGTIMVSNLIDKDGRQSKGVLLLRTLAMPSDTNANGDIFGGWIMSQNGYGRSDSSERNRSWSCGHRCC